MCHTLNPEFESHQCLKKYVDQKDWTVMLAGKRPVGFTPELCLRNRIRYMQKTMYARKGSILDMKSKQMSPNYQ